jgi:methionyl-tRNA formyltransferase
MNAGIDTGDILYVKEYTLDTKETGASLFDKLMLLGAEAIVEALPLIEAGKITPVPQNEAEATHAAKLTKQLGELDFTKSAVVLERLIRGLNSWPSAYTLFRGKQLKIWEAEVVDEIQADAEPGTVIAVDKQSITVAAGEGGLQILELQIEGKKRMACKDFLLGYPVSVGEKLG